MYWSLPCTVPEKWKDYSWDWTQVSAQNWTAYVGVQANGTNATYGAYSMCSEYQQVSWAISQLYNDKLALGKTSTCNDLPNGSPQSPSPASYSCSTMLAAAGSLGNNVPVPSATYLPGDGTYVGGSSGSVLSPGAKAGTAIAIIAVVAISAGFALFWWKRRKAKAIQRGLSPDGLEVDTGHSRAPDAELSGEGPKPEMWTNRNTTELPTPIGLRIPGSENRGSYTSVANPEGEETTGEAAELESNPYCSPHLGSSPGASPNTSPLQGTLSPVSPRLSQAVSSRPRTTEIDAEFAINHEYRDNSHPSQTS
jgi:hypothetical protein